MPKCEPFCPCGNHIRDFFKAAKSGDYELAASILYSVNPFPELTSALCDHERQCRGHCVKNRMGAPVDIPSMEAALGKAFPRPTSIKEPNGKSVAIIGAGPASLSASYFLAKEGYSVEVFEKEEGIGGAILTGIPDFRFDKSALSRIEADLRKMGVKFHLGTKVENALELKKSHDYVLVAVGAEKENKAFLPEAEGIVGGLDYLRNPEKAGDAKTVYVWGGGNVAMDCARTLIRKGKRTVLIYRRSRAEMPAAKAEIEEALSEGVELCELTNIKDVHLFNGRIDSMTLIKMRLGEPDESGRASFHEIEGSEETVPCEALVYALGEKPVLDLLIDASLKEGHQTSKPGIYLLGDARLGAKNIATAIKEGRQCAQEIIG